MCCSKLSICVTAPAHVFPYDQEHSHHDYMVCVNECVVHTVCLCCHQTQRRNQSCVQHGSTGKHASKRCLPFNIISFFRFDNVRLNIDALKLPQRNHGGRACVSFTLATHRKSIEVLSSWLWI